MVGNEEEQMEEEVNISSSGKLSELQTKVIEIKQLYQKAYAEEKSEFIPECFYLKTDVLMRKWKVLHIQSDVKWAEVHQMVLPVGYRKEVV